MNLYGKREKFSQLTKSNFSLYFMFRINYPSSNLSNHTHFSHSFHKQLSPTKITHLSDQISTPSPFHNTQDYYFGRKPQLQREKTKELKKKVEKMEKTQQIMKKRFDAYVMLLQNQIDLKGKQNKDMQRKINLLKQEFKEGQTDLQHINCYLQKKKKTLKESENKQKVERNIWVRTSLQPERLSTSSSFRLSTKLRSSGNLRNLKVRLTK